MLKDFLSSKATTAAMPLIHSTDFESFISILNSKEISSTFCKVLKEKILYTFYGRPAYKVSPKVSNTNDITFLPICFIFKSDCLEQVSNFFPFDTGAFENDIFVDYICRSKVPLEKFKFSNTANHPNQIIEKFFGNSKDYFYGNPKVCPSLNDEVAKNISNIALQAYVRLLSHSGATLFDDRSYTIECHLNNNLKLSDMLEAIIMPGSLMNDSSIANQIEEFDDIELLTYSTFRGDKPSDYNAVIRSLIEEYFREKGVI